MSKNNAPATLSSLINRLIRISKQEVKILFITIHVTIGTIAFVILTPTGYMNWPISRYIVVIVLAALVLPRVQNQLKTSDSSLLLPATQAFREGYHAAWFTLTVFIIDQETSSSDGDS